MQKIKLFRMICLLFSLVLLLGALSLPTAAATDAQVDPTLQNTLAQLAETVSEPNFGTFAGEWSVLCLARSGYYPYGDEYFESYYARIEQTVNETASAVSLANGALHKNKSTENSRLILALSAIGKDATQVGDWNLITPYDDFAWIKKQGINGPIFALIALDTNDYQTGDPTIRQQCIDFILSKRLDDGGWALSGSVSDPDITAMALQALYRYREQAAVERAAQEAFAWLSSAQREDGSYSSWGTTNSESIAQVIVAATTWGIDPNTDSRFVKDGGSAVDALLRYYVDEEAAFRHIMDTAVDAMATDQACYALIAYRRFLNGQNSLYDMSDIGKPAPEPTVPDETLPDVTVPEETLPDATVPEVTEPQPTETEPTDTEPTVPEETRPDATVPEETIPEATVPEVTEPQPTETVPEQTAPEASLPAPTAPASDGDGEISIVLLVSVVLIVLLLGGAIAIALSKISKK